MRSVRIRSSAATRKRCTRACMTTSSLCSCPRDAAWVWPTCSSSSCSGWVTRAPAPRAAVPRARAAPSAVGAPQAPQPSRHRPPHLLCFFKNKTGDRDTANINHSDVAPVSGVEKDKSGKLTAKWSTIQVPDGRVLLEGPETFYYASGQVMWSMKFHRGKKVGEESYFRADGTRVWIKTYGSDGSWTWQNVDRAGKQVATSKWHGKTLLSSDIPDVPMKKKVGDEMLPEPDGL